MIRISLVVICALLVACGGGGGPNGPRITSHPVSREVALNDSALFSVQVIAEVSRSYQWLKNGVPIEGATSASLTLTSVSYEDAGLYRVEVSDSTGSRLSDAAELTVVKQRATGLWIGHTGVINNNQIDIIIPPSGEMMAMRFQSGSISDFFLGEVRTRSNRWFINRDDGFALRCTSEVCADYDLEVRDEVLTTFAPRNTLSGTLRFYESGAPGSASTLTVTTAYSPLSARETSLNSLAGVWRYFQEGTQVVSMVLDADGVLTGDSYVFTNCAVSGGLSPVEGSTSLFHASLIYANRGEQSCGVTGLVETGYALIRSEDDGLMLSWYLYAPSTGPFYLPVRR